MGSPLSHPTRNQHLAIQEALAIAYSRLTADSAHRAFAMVNFLNSNLGSLMMSQNKALLTYRRSVTPNTTNTMMGSWTTRHQQVVIQ
ncbi:hypothetical protein Pmani_022281 [Petrolisthes manimaculis]|uniref:Uncharacterized protein n=1 Tax=Petrolisthes manimaculis TaxID=1843537 RepID=A0AAE1PD95_9EUCA|nr:hypothetical protein Pmani_022281 [Petrolisthes manimaculis]